MRAAEKIRQELKAIMSEGEANACQIYKGYDYDGTGQYWGWWYCKFGETPTYLDRSVNGALAVISAIVDSREIEREFYGETV